MARVLGEKCRTMMMGVKGTTEIVGKTTKPLTGILKPTAVSKELAHFLGLSHVSRTTAVKKIWEHIKSNNLQNPSNKREIICDDKLKSIFEHKEKVGFLEIAKLLKPHFVK